MRLSCPDCRRPGIACPFAGALIACRRTCDVVCLTGDSEVRVKRDGGAVSVPTLAALSGLRAGGAAKTAANARRHGIARLGVAPGEPIGRVARGSEGAACDPYQRAVENLFRVAWWPLP